MPGGPCAHVLLRIYWFSNHSSGCSLFSLLYREKKEANTGTENGPAEQREEQALEDTQNSWLPLQGQCNYNMPSPWCTALQEHVAHNYGFFSSIKTHTSTRIMPVPVCIILLACDQIRAPLCLCVDPDTPSCLAERTERGRCGKRMHGLSEEWKPWGGGGGGSAVFMLFMAPPQ